MKYQDFSMMIDTYKNAVDNERELSKKGIDIFMHTSLYVIAFNILLEQAYTPKGASLIKMFLCDEKEFRESHVEELFKKVERYER